MNDSDISLLKRFTILKNLEYYIKESVYYRSFSEEMPVHKRSVIWNYNDNSGNIALYEDSIRRK